MDFAVNSEKLTEAQEECSAKAEAIDEVIEKIYTEIGNLKESWQGNSYETFVASSNDYKPQLKLLTTFIREYGDLLGAALEPYETLETKLKTILNMGTVSTSGGTSGNSTGGGSTVDENQGTDETVNDENQGTDETSNAVAARDEYDSQLNVAGSVATASALGSATHNYYYGDEDNTVALLEDINEGDYLNSATVTVKDNKYTTYFDGDGNLKYYTDSEGNYYDENGKSITQTEVDSMYTTMLGVGDTQTFNDVSGDTGKYTYVGHSDEYNQDFYKGEDNSLYLLNEDGEMHEVIDRTSPLYDTVSNTLQTDKTTVSRGAILDSEVSSQTVSNVIRLNVGDKHTFVDADSATGGEKEYTYAGYWKQGEKYIYKDDNNNLCLLNDDGKMKKVVEPTSQFYTNISSALNKDVVEITDDGNVLSDKASD